MNIVRPWRLGWAVLSATARLVAGSLMLGLLVAPRGASADATRDPPSAILAGSIPAAVLLALPRSEADHTLLAATHGDALPEGYVPPDLVALGQYGLPQRGAQQLREIVIPDLWAMVQAAQADRVQLSVISSYRSFATQAYTYNGYVWQWGTQVADQRSARPGHSQHQLGTAIDFNQLSPAFMVSSEGQWLWQHGHEYGFVFPYTPASVGRTGYIFEPWHVRWVGRDLAQAMWEAGYQDSDALTADDYVADAREALLAAAQR